MNVCVPQKCFISREALCVRVQLQSAAWALPPSPYGHRKRPLPPQVSACVTTNCVECVGIKHPIIQRRHAIKRAAAAIRSRHHVTITQPGELLLLHSTGPGGLTFWSN